MYLRMVLSTFRSYWGLIIFLWGEEPLEASSIGVRMLMSVLKLVNIANIREVLAIARNILLKPSHSFENSFIRFINLHKLQL